MMAALALIVPGLGLPYLDSLTATAAFFVGLVTQATKIVTDTALQVDIADDYRGRVFSVNDTAFNLLFVVGLGRRRHGAAGPERRTSLPAGLMVALHRGRPYATSCPAWFLLATTASGQNAPSPAGPTRSTARPPPRHGSAAPGPGAAPCRCRQA